MEKIKSLKRIIEQQNAVFLYFKNNQCAPCKALRPKVEKLLSDSFPQMDLIIVDSIESPELNNEFQVFANPTLLVFFEGKEYIRKSKYVSIPELETEIARLYKMIFD